MRLDNLDADARKVIARKPRFHRKPWPSPLGCSLPSELQTQVTDQCMIGKQDFLGTKKCNKLYILNFVRMD